MTKVTNYAANDRAISEYEYEYDLSGAITKETSIVEGKKTVREFEYDAVGSLHSETVSAGKSTCKYTYEYDHSGNRTKVTSDENGKKSTVTYQYDKADRLTKTSDSVNGNTLFTYDANGNRASKTGSDGVKYTYEYDTENRLRAVKDNGTLLMAALYDGNGDRVFTVNRSTRNYTETTSQPGVNSPTGATHGADSSDNTSNAGLNGQPQGTMYLYAYDDKLPEDPANSIFWYGFGQGMINSIMVASAHLSVWFNEMWETITEHFELFARRLGELGILGSEEKEYSYDYKGAKPSQQLQDQMYLYQTMMIPYGFSDKTEEDYELMLYVNDVNRGYTETLATYGTDGYVNTVYTYGNERLISEQFGKSSYYTYNGRGDVSSLLSDTGAPQVSYSYDAYGNYAATAANDNPYKFNAEAFDYSTGFQYLRSRYYDNSIGGFITQDTNMGNIEVPVTLNLYTYVGNDPLNTTDPSGHGWLSDTWNSAKKKASNAWNTVKKTAVTVWNETKKTAVNMWNKVNSWGEKVVEETKEFAEKIEEKAVETYQKGQKYVAKKCKQAVSTIHKHVCTTTARIQKNIERVKVATEALAKSVTTWVSDHKEVLITGALIVGTAALVVATGGIGAACVPGLIAATAGGALLGAGGDVVGQMISNGSMDLSKIDWGSVALSGLAGGATGLLSATGAGPVAMGIMGGVSSGASEIYHQMQSGEDINWGQVAVRTLGGAVSGAVLGNVGSQTASGAKEIAKNAGKVFLANGGVSFAENLTYNLMGGEDLGTAAKQASFSALISGGTSAGFYALGQAAKNMCFVEGTMVLTAEGLVAIESIAVGDMVIATDPETGETAEKEVKNTFVNETEELAHVFVNGEEIVCTPGHKFYAPEKGWTSAIELRAGDQLQLVNGKYVTVEKVQHELLEEPVKVYNFEVEDFHTYYVGTDVQVLVHNECLDETNTQSNGVKNSDIPKWRQSEIDAADSFPGYKPQQSFLNGESVKYGTKGSVRPDYYSYEKKHSVDVKNYNVTNSRGRNKLAKNIEKQYYQRLRHLPENTKQTVFIDVRGQNVSEKNLRSLYDSIMRRTKKEVEVIFQK